MNSCPALSPAFPPLPSDPLPSPGKLSNILASDSSSQPALKPVASSLPNAEAKTQALREKNVSDSKKNGLGSNPQKTEIPLDTLGLPDRLLNYLNSLEMITIGDVVPNMKRSDLQSLKQANRQDRRKLEGIFREKKVLLR